MKITPARFPPDHLYAQTAVLIDAETGDVLFDKDSLVRMYPASTTKMMTLLLALESDIPLDQEIVIPEVAENVPSDSSLVPVYEGERMTFQDLLYGTMLHSGNDGANAIAYLVGGSIAQFVDMMNERAAQIGCTGTHFSNAHGYHDETHYSTAHDLASSPRRACATRPSARSSPPPPTPWPPPSTVGPTTSPIPPPWSTPQASITTRAASASRPASTAAPPVLRGRFGARRRFPHQRGAGRGAHLERHGVPNGRTRRSSLNTAFPSISRICLTDLYEASGRNINTVSIANARRGRRPEGSAGTAAVAVERR